MLLYFPAKQSSGKVQNIGNIAYLSTVSTFFPLSPFELVWHFCGISGSPAKVCVLTKTVARSSLKKRLCTDEIFWVTHYW